MWRLYHREAIVDGILVGAPGNIGRIILSPSGPNSAGVVVSGVDDTEIVLEGVVHEFAGYRAVSLFLVNRRTKGALGDRSKDERWIYQPRLRVTTAEGVPAFVAKDFREDPLVMDDGEAGTSALLFRHAREFATGHGVAAGWEQPVEDGRRTTAVFTDFIPTHEVPLLIAPNADADAATLDMKALCEATSADQVISFLSPMVHAYEDWIDAAERASLAPDIQSDAQLKDAAMVNIARCKECAARMRAGLALLKRDLHALRAFQFANRAMWDQRIHSLWAAANRKRGTIAGSANDFNKPDNRTWRPFQMGFILLNLSGIADETSEDRRLVDLLWFPTGGEKTEAYLGISAFTLALRRLRGDRHGMVAGAGTSIIMRYTLRLLTVQQFQRAAALICACEFIRRGDPASWGDEPFRIGVWVGRGMTPNTFADSRKALEDIGDGKKPRSGSPVQFVACPRCGTSLVGEKGRPEKNTYQVDTNAQRTLIWCCNEHCEFSPAASNNQGIPAVLVDEEIYRTCPTLIVATVDKSSGGDNSELFLESGIVPEGVGDSIARVVLARELLEVRALVGFTRIDPPI